MRIVALEGQFDQIFAKFARIDVIENTEITTKKLCINGTNSTSCISEKELRKLLEKESTPAPSQSYQIQGLFFPVKPVKRFYLCISYQPY